jgi:predicted Rossmann fold flavoprotein
MGLVLRSDAGRVFPVTDQASSVLKALEMEASRLSVHVVTEFDALSIGRAKDAGRLAVVSRSGGSLFGRSVILACGGKSYPAFGSDGSAYRLAQKLGHSIVEPVPVAVPLVVKHRLCHTAQGQKIAATVRAFIGQAEAARAHGDVLFTKYGLSGTAILDVSEGLSIALNRDKRRDASVIVDMAPFIDKDSLAAELASRAGRKLPWGDLLVGILPNRLSAALADTLRAAGPAGAAEAVKNMRFEVTGTRGWNEADFTAGGVDVREVDSGTLESRKIAGVYFAGEMLDVNGARGGYNLAWAWASGFLAGKAAADA